MAFGNEENERILGALDEGRAEGRREVIAELKRWALEAYGVADIGILTLRKMQSKLDELEGGSDG